MQLRVPRRPALTGWMAAHAVTQQQAQPGCSQPATAAAATLQGARNLGTLLAELSFVRCFGAAQEPPSDGREGPCGTASKAAAAAPSTAMNKAAAAGMDVPWWHCARKPLVRLAQVVSAPLLGPKTRISASNDGASPAAQVGAAAGSYAHERVRSGGGDGSSLLGSLHGLDDQGMPAGSLSLLDYLFGLDAHGVPAGRSAGISSAGALSGKIKTSLPEASLGSPEHLALPRSVATPGHVTLWERRVASRAGLDAAASLTGGGLAVTVPPATGEMCMPVLAIEMPSQRDDQNEQDDLDTTHSPVAEADAGQPTAPPTVSVRLAAPSVVPPRDDEDDMSVGAVVQEITRYAVAPIIARFEAEDAAREKLGKEAASFGHVNPLQAEALQPASKPWVKGTEPSRPALSPQSQAPPTHVDAGHDSRPLLIVEAKPDKRCKRVSWADPLATFIPAKRPATKAIVTLLPTPIVEAKPDKRCKRVSWADPLAIVIPAKRPATKATVTFLSPPIVEAKTDKRCKRVSWADPLTTFMMAKLGTASADSSAGSLSLHVKRTMKTFTKRESYSDPFISNVPAEPVTVQIYVECAASPADACPPEHVAQVAPMVAASLVRQAVMPGRRQQLSSSMRVARPVWRM
eukprot:202718-Chlamydomonas_euryale.AAC.6